MSVTIRLSRCDHKERDDVIVIRPRLSEGFLVRYVDGLVPKRVWVSDKTYFEVLDYLERIFAGLNDIDPFRGIQFDIPGYPLVFYQVSDFNPEVVRRMLETIREWIINPPTSFVQ